MSTDKLVSIDPRDHDVEVKSEHWVFLALAYGLYIPLFAALLLAPNLLRQLPGGSKLLFFVMFVSQFLLIMVLGRTTYWALVVLPHKISELESSGLAASDEGGD